MKRKLAVARFWFEGNAFCPHTTGRTQFELREWTCGDAAIAAARGTASELAAVADFAVTHTESEVTTLRCASASPGGPIDDAVYAQIVDEITRGLAGTHWDAVYLSLHGAAITHTRLAPDLDLVRAVRQAIGTATVLGASFDLHANLHPDMATLLDVASGYRTYPHVDMRETAARVLDLIERKVRGEIAPTGVIVRPRIVLPSFNMRTDDGPMAALQTHARLLEHAPVLDASVFGGFPYADTPDTGAAVMVYADGNRAAAERAAQALSDEIAALAAQFEPRLTDAATGLRQALSAPPGLVAVTDPGDNPLSGGIGDTPELFRALLAAAPAVPTVFAFFADARTVARATAAGVGATIDVMLGAQHSADFGAPIAARARVLRLTDGRFRNSGPMERGLAVQLGRTAVLDVQGIQVIVTQHCMPANDPAFFALHGIDLAATRLLCVKAKNHFRAAFEDRCTAIIDVDCPGPAAADLRTLPFRHVRC